MKATGFKAITQTGIVVTAKETHNAARSCSSSATCRNRSPSRPKLRRSSSRVRKNRRPSIPRDLEDLTLKGRDLFGYMKPGSGRHRYREPRRHQPGAISGININGGFTALNFTVDGITDMDTGSNTSLHYEPNLDAIQELKVLTSNYQAEFGRNSGGTITVVTKNGTQDFHGTAAWNHRHEEFNANSWVNNHTVKNGAATPRVPYRYNVETYSIGGPVFIPKHCNRDRRRLFFFWSQEYTGQFVAGSTPDRVHADGARAQWRFLAELQ